MKGIPGLGLVLLLVIAATVPAAALDKPPASWKTGSEPLQVEARSMDLLAADNVVVFQGDVAARQGEVTLHADRVEVRADPKTREIRSVKAKGSVRLHKGDIVAAGDEAVYDAVQGVAVLTGSPKVWRGKDVVAGDKITLYLAEDRSVVEGAKAVIYPPAKGEGGAAQ
ncbi:MAG: lipopolysaccharide transport periplasmic protein LptA [Deltaproteobacteria bacterium]|nr:lipopolysaccharide transport periplasmic protein LptA [Deltaproteobacteria bacterium]